MLGKLAVLTCAALACATAPASAGTILVTDDGTTATAAYTATPTEANRVHVAFDGATLVVTDARRRVVVDPRSAAGACTTSPGEARCAIAGELVEVRASLGENADTFTAALAADDYTALIVDGGQGRDTLHGDSDSRVTYYATELIGGLGDDVLSGGPDFETLEGGPGADDIHGGGGDDNVVYGSLAGVTHPAPFGVVVTLDDVANDGMAPTGGAALEGDNVHSDVESIIGTDGPDRLYGSDVYNFLQGRGGNDLLVLGGDVDSASGGDGDDTIRSRDGIEDYLNCDEGNDTLIGDTFDFHSECEVLDLA